DQIDRDSQMSKASRAANSVQISFSHFGEIEVDDNIDGLNVNATSKEITANKITAEATPEVVKHAVSVRLRHASVDVVARIAQLSNLLRQQFHALGGIAEDDRLVDLELREQSVQAVNFLTFLYKSIVLGDTL